MEQWVQRAMERAVDRGLAVTNDNKWPECQKVLFLIEADKSLWNGRDMYVSRAYSSILMLYRLMYGLINSETEIWLVVYSSLELSRDSMYYGCEVRLRSCFTACLYSSGWNFKCATCPPFPDLSQSKSIKMLQNCWWWRNHLSNLVVRIWRPRNSWRRATSST